jgi:hypothetical protein
VPMARIVARLVGAEDISDGEAEDAETSWAS